MEEIQKTLLSLIFLYPKERCLIFKELDEVHFKNQYRTIYKVCKKLYQENREIDPVVVVSIVGAEYTVIVAHIADASLIIKPNTVEYIKLLRDDYSKKQAIIKNKELLVKIEKDALTPEDIQNEYLEISQLFNRESNIKKVNMLQGFTDILDDLENKTEYMKTWFTKIDNYILIDRGDYIIIGGRPSSGKTTLATNFMIELSRKYTVDFFSFETSSLKVFRKIASTAGRISINKIQHKALLETDYDNLISAASNYQNHKLNVIEAAGMNVQDIVSIAQQDKADIIFIDYIQLIQGKGKSLYEQTTSVSKDLHTFAQKEKTTVIAMAQLNRAEGNKRPNMSSLRESGQIEQDADVVMLLYDPEDSNNINIQRRECIIAKNKTGRTGIINLNFLGETQTFKEA